LPTNTSTSLTSREPPSFSRGELEYCVCVSCFVFFRLCVSFSASARAQYIYPHYIIGINAQERSARRRMGAKTSPTTRARRNAWLVTPRKWRMSSRCAP
jgi:hypothetical protein